MDIRRESTNSPNFKGYVTLLSLASVLIGILVLVGHQFEIVALTSIVPFWLPMKANTAICFILAGLATLLMRDPHPIRICFFLANLLALFILIYCLATAAEYLFNLNFHIDAFFFPEETKRIEDIIYPGRVAIATLIGLISLSVSILLMDHRIYKDSLFEFFACITFMIGFFSLLGYFYNINTVFGFTFFTKMSIHTALGFIFLSLAILLARPQVGMIRQLCAPSETGRSLRFLFAYMFIIPTLIGYLENLGEKINLWGPEFGDNVQLTGTIVGLVIVVLIDAKNRERK